MSSGECRLKVELKTFAVAMRLGADGITNAADRSGVDVLVREYLRRSRSPLIIATSPGDDEAAASQRTALIRAYVIKAVHKFLPIGREKGLLC